MTVALADDPGRPQSYAPREPRGRSLPTSAPVDEARLERDMAEPEG
jgi:hypothetical protein